MKEGGNNGVGGTGKRAQTKELKANSVRNAEINTFLKA